VSRLFTYQKLPLAVFVYNDRIMNFMLPGKFVVPEIVTTQFHLNEGEVVADFGAGSGFFLKSLVEAVGPTGTVYACEIQKPLVERIGEYVRQQGYSNVRTLWCDLEEQAGIKIPSGTLDAGILVNTLFQLQLKSVALEEMHRTLRRGGVLHIIDWSESFGGIGPKPVDVLTEEAAIALCEAAHFVFERKFVAGEHHYGFTVRKV
jgi:ubiquinone/menaquinone biosynthesis C-methylase UbiE